MRKINVTSENCEDIAGELVDNLRGYTLMVVSIAVGENVKDELRTIPEAAKLKAGFVLNNGLVTIPLVTVSGDPSRKISWDIGKESVTISYLDSGAIKVDRIDKRKGTAIYRMIIKLSW